MKNFLWVESFRPKRVSDCILPSSIKETFQSFVNDGKIPNLILSGGLQVISDKIDAMGFIS